jgi:hypothetical protein
MWLRSSTMISVPGRVWSLHANLIAHRSGWNKQRGFFVEEFRRAFLQPIDGRVFTINVVANFGIGHSAAHGGGGFGDCIAS